MRLKHVLWAVAHALAAADLVLLAIDPTRLLGPIFSLPGVAAVLWLLRLLLHRGD